MGRINCSRHQGYRLKNSRIMRGLSLGELSLMSGISLQRILSYERYGGIIDAATLGKICPVINVSREYIVTEAPWARPMKRKIDKSDA